jgi:tetratricopeptide (TPR) repeat protein
MPAMRFFIPVILIALATPSHAEDPLLKSAAAQPDRIVEQALPPLTPPDIELNQLFSMLKKERKPDAARLIAERIKEDLQQSGSPTVDLLMDNAVKAIAEKRYGAALDFLDQVTLLAPDFAEGWNQRAILHYLMGNYPKSMSDTAHVLTLEPRHLGALAGLADILARTGHDQQALEALQAYLDRYPADRDVQKQVIDLMIKLDGQRT